MNKISLLLTSLMIDLSACASFTMRIDDNHPVADWERVADIFERRGVRLSLAVVPIGEEKTDE